MITATKKQRKENLRKLQEEQSDRIRHQKTESPHQAEILKYCKEWRNLYAIAGKFDSFIPAMRGYLRQLEHEGLLISNDEDYRSSAGYPGGEWLNKERQIAQECFWIELEFVGNLIKFWIGEDKAVFGKDAREPISFEVPRNYVKTQVRRRPQLSPVDYAGAWVNIHKSKHLSLSIYEKRDEIYFVDDKNKLIFFSKHEIEKILKIDNDLTPQEFFLYKQNEKELKRGDRVLINYYQFGIFETLPNEWEFLRFKKPFHCEIKRGDAIGDNFKKIELWRIQKCSSTANSSEELEDLAAPSDSTLAIESPQPDIAISQKMRSLSTDLTSQTCQSTETSEPTTQPEENLTCSPSHSLAQEHQMQATAKGSQIQSQDCGEKDLESCAKSSQNSLSGNNPWELSSEDLENCLEESEWEGIRSSLQKSKLEASARHTSAQEYLSLPTMTANEGKNSRPSGSSKLEQKCVKLGITPNGSKLSPEAMSLLMGFPANWCEAIAPSQPLNQPASQGVKEGTKPESSSVNPSVPLKPALHSQESVISHRAQTDKLPTEQQQIAIGDLVVISNRHKVSAGRIFEVGEVRSGNYITTKEGFCYSPTRYERFNPVGSLLKIDSQHPTLGNRIVEGDGYKNGYIEMLGGGCVALEMVVYQPITNTTKKRGRRKGSANKKAASGSLSIRKDVKSGAGIYSYWDIEIQKIKKLSVPSTLTARVDKAIKEDQGVPDIIGIIKGTDAQLTLKF